MCSFVLCVSCLKNAFVWFVCGLLCVVWVVFCIVGWFVLVCACVYCLAALVCFVCVMLRGVCFLVLFVFVCLCVFFNVFVCGVYDVLCDVVWFVCWCLFVCDCVWGVFASFVVFMRLCVPVVV